MAFCILLECGSASVSGTRWQASRRLGAVTTTMTVIELIAILDRLESFGPQQRLTGKRAHLTEVRERLLALHARGHSWRAIARELSAAGEKVSADLLRAVCGAKVKHCRAKRARTHEAALPAARPQVAAQMPPPPTLPKNEGGFGAKGLRP